MAIYRERDPETNEFYETMAPPIAEPVRARPLYAVQMLINLIVGVINGLLAIRILLELFAANSANAFANLIYNLTDPLVQPFVNLFNYSFQNGVARLDVAALAAIIVYSLVAFILTRLLDINRV